MEFFITRELMALKYLLKKRSRELTERQKDFIKNRISILEKRL